MDVDTVARYLSVSRDFVYAHAVELGGRKLGTSPKAPWRFSLPELSAPRIRERRMFPTLS